MGKENVVSVKDSMLPEIITISINKNFKRKYYEKKLLKESAEETRLNGISSIQLYVNTEDLTDIRLYENNDFKKIREVKDIRGPKEMCYEMELRIL
ncbi:MAG TPA: hypothetical protein HA262_17550 [Methanosarcina sp.]|jgi:ribosomal-protein-alanine N-acetyltransferase|nr:hypothetical protein [Methanosarcina sp.]